MSAAWSMQRLLRTSGLQQKARRAWLAPGSKSEYLKIQREVNHSPMHAASSAMTVPTTRG